MISVCGVICSECPAFHAKVKGPEHQKYTADAWDRIYDLAEKAENISCGGCLGPDDEIFHTSRMCNARICCRLKGFGTCAECPLTTCKDLEKAQSNWDSVPDLIHQLSAAEFERYARPYCGHRKRLSQMRASLHP